MGWPNDLPESTLTPRKLNGLIGEGVNLASYGCLLVSVYLSFVASLSKSSAPEQVCARNSSSSSGGGDANGERASKRARKFGCVKCPTR